MDLNCYVVFNFMAIFLKSKDRKIRFMRRYNELFRCRFQYFLRSSFVSVVAKQCLSLRYASLVSRLLVLSMRVRNRCVLTNKVGSVFRYFKVSRIMIKEFGSRGFLTGVRRSSW